METRENARDDVRINRISTETHVASPAAVSAARLALREHDPHATHETGVPPCCWPLVATVGHRPCAAKTCRWRRSSNRHLAAIPARRRLKGLRPSLNLARP